MAGSVTVGASEEECVRKAELEGNAHRTDEVPHLDTLAHFLTGKGDEQRFAQVLHDVGYSLILRFSLELWIQKPGPLSCSHSLPVIMAQTQASCDVRGGAAAGAAHPGCTPSMPVQASVLDVLVCISRCSLHLPVAPLVMLSSKHVFLLPGQAGSGSCFRFTRTLCSFAFLGVFILWCHVYKQLTVSSALFYLSLHRS